MKFDDQLAAYLYENKSLKLEGIGTFTLDGKASVPGVSDKEVYYPIEGLAFTYNPKSDTDENLILFLVKKLGKIQPLIRSDLESYLSNIKQFINIGKPYTIVGIGTLSKNNKGLYEFTPGNFLPVKEELHPRRENEEHNYPVNSGSSAGRVVAIILIVLAALAALGGIGWGISNLLANQQNETTTEDNQEQGYSDTLIQENQVDSTTATAGTSTDFEVNQPTVSAKDSVAKTVQYDSVKYKMIFEITDWKEKAYKRKAQLNRLQSTTALDTIHKDGIVNYRLYIPMKIRNADSARIKDSLRRLFGGRIIAVKQ